MVRLATVRTTFHARVIAARLGAEGIVTDLRGNVDGIYPMGDVHVFVSEEEAEYIDAKGGAAFEARVKAQQADLCRLRRLSCV